MRKDQLVLYLNYGIQMKLSLHVSSLKLGIAYLFNFLIRFVKQPDILELFLERKFSISEQTLSNETK